MLDALTTGRDLRHIFHPYDRLFTSSLHVSASTLRRLSLQQKLDQPLSTLSARGCRLLLALLQKAGVVFPAAQVDLSSFLSCALEAGRQLFTYYPLPFSSLLSFYLLFLLFDLYILNRENGERD